MNIYQRINEVRKVVDYAQKKKAVETYKAVTHDQITGLTREHFVTFGVVVVPAGIVSQKTELTGTQTSRGTPFIRFEAVYRWEIVNADDPSDKFTAETAAHAIDHGDKAPGKAFSYAKKGLVLKLLEIESGEEDEERQEQFKPKAASATQATRDAFDALPKDRRNVVLDTATQVVDALNEDRDFDAYALCESVADPEEKIALWSRFDSKQRSRIKAQSAKERKVSS